MSSGKRKRLNMPHEAAISNYILYFDTLGNE